MAFILFFLSRNTNKAEFENKNKNGLQHVQNVVYVEMLFKDSVKIKSLLPFPSLSIHLFSSISNKQTYGFDSDILICFDAVCVCVCV